MKEFTILIDSTADLPEEYIKKNNIIPTYMGFTMDGIDYVPKTDVDMQPKEFYTNLRNGKMAKTSMISIEQFKKAYINILNEGKDILCLIFSSGLSGTYNSAVLAKDEIIKDYPNSTIYVIDSLCASLGFGLFVNYAVNLKNQGLNIDKIYEIMEHNKNNFCHYFTVDDLNFLYRGGRVSKTSAIMGTLLGIKPIMHVNEEGKLILIGKIRGRKQSIDVIVDKLCNKLILEENSIIFISHGDCLEDAKYAADKIKEKTGIKDFIINYVGTTIGSHSGPGTVAIFGFGKNREEKAL